MSQETIESTEEAVAAATAVMSNVWEANVKKVFDQLIAMTEVVNAERSVNAQREVEFNDSIKNLFLRQVEAGQQIQNMMMTNAATSANLANNNAAAIAQAAATNAQVQSNRMTGNQGTIDNIALVDGITNLKAAQIARDSMMSDVAMDLKNVAGQAVETAQAAQTAATAAQAAASGFGVVSAPVPQGTTGTAQGGMQLGQSVAIESLMASNATATNAILASIAELNKAISLLIVKVSGDVAVAQ